MRTLWACVFASVALFAAVSDQKETVAEVPSESKSAGFTEGEIISTNGKETTGAPFRLKPVDCADHLLMGSTTSGVYEIYPFSCSCSEPVRVWCDMETDGGGWTVFMTRQRQTPQVNFNRSWTEYRTGFGDAEGEFWLGNEMMHRITSSRTYSLRVDFTLTRQGQKFAEWEEFRLDDERNKYKINLQDYLPWSTAQTNCLTSMNNRFFTTYDRDYDYHVGNCAATIGGGWWVNNCRYMHLTGVYEQGLNTSCTGTRVQVSRAQMKIRPAVCTEALRRISLDSHQCGTCV
ncbi:ficolin-2-like [Penaeus indicus]|uniref:ficolin-2-like n=1 Tax=Penaeus indicus TaxID=29960 RepID=UPI00300D93A3